MKKRLSVTLGMSVAAFVMLFNSPSAMAAVTPDQYVKMGLGLFPHYGLNTYTGTIGGQGNPQNYPSSLFDPTDFDADQWVSAAKAAGVEYVICVTKHRYGWCSWDTASTTYDVATSSAPTIDIVDAVRDACDTHGLKLALYFNSDDRYHFPNGTYDVAAYTQFAKDELYELLTNYGDIIAVWFDIADHLSVSQALELKSYIKSIQPDCLVLFNKRNSIADVSVRELELGGPSAGNDTPWEECAAMYDTDSYWSFDDDDDFITNYGNPEYVMNNLIHAYNKKYASFAMAISPGPNGQINDVAVDFLHRLGWLTRWKQIDDRDTEVTYGGSWTEESGDTGYFKSTDKYSTAANAYAELTFTGTSIRLITKTGSQCGKFDIYLDGNYVTTYDAYAASGSHDVVAYENTSLSNTSHTIKMVVTHTKNPSSGGYTCRLDLFEYGNTPVKLDDRDGAVTYSGSWSNKTEGDAYEDTLKYSSQANAYAEVTFTGTAVRLVTKNGASAGIFDLYLDNVKVATYDSYSPSSVFDMVAYENLSLSSGSHTIKMVATGTKNASSGGYYCHLDYIEYKK